MFSILLGLLTFRFFDLNPYIYVLVIVFGGILIDFDSKKSWIGRKLGVISQVINFIFGHRRFFHSVLFVLVLCFVFILFSEYWIAFLIGSLGHLVLDCLTKEGIRPFFPLKYRIKGFFKTNSFFEVIFFILVSIVDIILLVNLIYS
ncbi:metal-dependent hydrolase [archaeon]|nr:metal-dependent hydrolase [archaeon]